MTGEQRRREGRRKADRETHAAGLMGQGIYTELGDELAEATETVRNLRESVDELSAAWQRRYVESVVRRRRVAFLLAVGIIVGMWLNDLHMDACVVDAYVRGQEPSAICDMSHPMHTHGYRDDTGIVGAEWPSAWSWVGIGLYASFFAGGLWWYRRPVPEAVDPPADDDEVPEVQP